MGRLSGARDDNGVGVRRRLRECQSLFGSLVSGQDLSQPAGIRISGSIRFYLGDFGSIEYYEMPLFHMHTWL